MSKNIPKKRFGQNFLVADDVIFSILDGLHLTPGDNLLEIGPGRGALTKHLVHYNLKKFSCVEVDHVLVQKLQEWVPENIALYCEDILDFDFAKIASIENPVRVFGNLPYNISTPILMHCLDNLQYIKDMNFMLQKEVADRICARPGSADYGRLSVRLQVSCETKSWLAVAPDSFDPQPKVNSAMINLKPKTCSVDIQKLDIVLRKAFSARRKVMKNAMSGLLTESDLPNPTARPDSISVEEYLLLARKL